MNWIKIILEDINRIADLNYQRKAWLEGAFDYPCHFEEIMSSLYDSGKFNSFIDKYKNSNEITEKQTNLLILLNNKLEEFYYKPSIYHNSLPPYIDERKVLADPEWHEIRQIAQDVIDAFKDFN